MKTVTIQVGNSDDKLTQLEWSEFVSQVDGHIEHFVEDRAATVHFFGAPANHAPWQNAAWVIGITEEAAEDLRNRLSRLRKAFSQDSVAWTVGETDFI